MLLALLGFRLWTYLGPVTAFFFLFLPFGMGMSILCLPYLKDTPFLWFHRLIVREEVASG